MRGTTATRLRWDLSGSIGQNQVDTFIFDTVNASLGPDSPTSFKPNLLQQTETGLNADLSYVASDTTQHRRRRRVPERAVHARSRR